MQPGNWGWKSVFSAPSTPTVVVVNAKIIGADNDDAGVVVTYHDGITVERPGTESRREILACVHVEEDGRREEYGAISGSLSEEAADSGLPAGALQRRSEPELPLPGQQYRRDGDRNADAAGAGSEAETAHPGEVF